MNNELFSKQREISGRVSLASVHNVIVVRGQWKLLLNPRGGHIVVR